MKATLVVFKLPRCFRNRNACGNARRHKPCLGPPGRDNVQENMFQQNIKPHERLDS